eukprot:gb/GECG01005269.1/.p1 GENE.gb/GECG01005269.1/~~gb/GECG01005269.1/.p1  ORF type:complete len:1018 (+),score=140.62 gb/GECG01005269.1/:1-3054(+)
MSHASGDLPCYTYTASSPLSWTTCVVVNAELNTHTHIRTYIPKMSAEDKGGGSHKKLKVSSTQERDEFMGCLIAQMLHSHADTSVMDTFLEEWSRKYPDWTVPSISNMGKGRQLEHLVESVKPKPFKLHTKRAPPAPGPLASTDTSTGTNAAGESVSEAASALENLTSLLEETPSSSSLSETAPVSTIAASVITTSTLTSETHPHESGETRGRKKLHRDEEWSEEEVKTLKRLVKKYKKDKSIQSKDERFQKVADELANRTKKECYRKYKELTKHSSSPLQENRDAEAAHKKHTAEQSKQQTGPLDSTLTDESNRDTLSEALGGHRTQPSTSPSVKPPTRSKEASVWDNLLKTSANYATQDSVTGNREHADLHKSHETEILIEEGQSTSDMRLYETARESDHRRERSNMERSANNAFLENMPGDTKKIAPQPAGKGSENQGELVIDEAGESNDQFTPRNSVTDSTSSQEPKHNETVWSQSSTGSSAFVRQDAHTSTRPVAGNNSTEVTDVLEDFEEEEEAELDNVEVSRGHVLHGISDAGNVTSSTERIGQPHKYVLTEEMDHEAVGINLSLASALRELLFGVPTVDHATGKKSSAPPLKTFSKSWMRHGLQFTETPKCGWGLVQSAGGPCGALAAIQAHTVKQLYYSELCDRIKTLSETKEEWRDPPTDLKVEALKNAIWEMLSIAASSRGEKDASPLLALPSKYHDACKGDGGQVLPAVTQENPEGNSSKTSKVQYTPDQFTERLKLFEIKSKEHCMEIVDKNQGLFFDPKAPGLACLVVSAVLSRGIGIPPETANSFNHPLLRKAAGSSSSSKSRGVLGDMDFGLGSSATLIGSHNYATQELVNLLLTGCASSNVFDGERRLGSSENLEEQVVMHGIQSRGDIGFLTLFEHYDHVHVGNYLKRPRYPIWIICSESHYTTVFSPPRALIKANVVCDKDACEHEPNNVVPLELHYWDGLARQDEPIKFTLSPSEELARAEKTTAVGADLDVPPLNLVLRTRWPACSVDWNGVEPWL